MRLDRRNIRAFVACSAALVTIVATLPEMVAELLHRHLSFITLVNFAEVPTSVLLVVLTTVQKATEASFLVYFLRCFVRLLPK